MAGAMRVLLQRVSSAAVRVDAVEEILDALSRARARANEEC